MMPTHLQDLVAEVNRLLASIPKVYGSAKVLHSYGMLGDETPEAFLERYIQMNPRISEAASYAVARGIIDGSRLEPIKGIDLTIQRCSWFNEYGLII